MKRKLFAFDLDGTLLDAYPGIIASMNHTLGRLNLPQAEPDAIVRAVGLGNGGLIRAFVPEAHFREAQRIYREHHLPQLATDSRLLPGALELLENLKAHGKKLAVATNRPRESADILLDTLRLRSYFDRVLVGDEVPNPKPAPDILLALLEHFGVAPAETLYVGDMTIDAQTGAAAGVDTLIVITGSSSREEVAAVAPYRIIDSLDDFPAGEYRD